MLDQRGGDLPTGKSHHEVVAEAKQLVVPSFAGLDEGTWRQIRVLLVEESPHEAAVDRDLGTGHSLKIHGGESTVRRPDIGGQITVESRS